MAEELSYLNQNSSQKSSGSCDEVVVKEKCVTCKYYRSNFICKNCIVSGKICKSNDAKNESFEEKNKKMREVLAEKETVAVACRKLLMEREKYDQLPTEILECSERIKMLKYLIQEKRENTNKISESVKILKEKNQAREIRLPKYRERVEKLAFYVKNNMKSEIVSRKAQFEKKKAQLKKVVQKDVELLIRHVFPIDKINPTSKSTDEDVSEMISALAEASKTSFVRGTWVLMDSSGELHHRIIAPTLPGSGDYSAFLAQENENGVPIMEQIGNNEAYNIGAALGYTAQLVNLLSFYLDVLLPKKVSYTDFCLKHLAQRQFQRKVAWLNSNVLYLCFSQGMDSVLLNPKHTLNNILNLVNHADLGQTGPFQVDAGLVLSLEVDMECVADVGGAEDSDVEDDEGSTQFPWEWEAIPLVSCPESTPGGMTRTQGSSSIAGGLVASVASMFRGWTGK